MSKVWVRICYKYGINREENKLFELHKMCECDWCKSKYMGRKRCNDITAYAHNQKEIDDLTKILNEWTCADKTKDLPTFYYNHSGYTLN